MIPYSRGDVQAYLIGSAKVLKLDYLDDGARIKVRCDKAVADRAEKLLR